eukprot:6015076-Amphidinium_carterae.1
MPSVDRHWKQGQRHSPLSAKSSFTGCCQRQQWRQHSFNTMEVQWQGGSQMHPVTHVGESWQCRRHAQALHQWLQTIQEYVVIFIPAK